MPTFATQDKDFLEAVISKTLLEDSIDWIRKNLDPEDVFTEKDLLEWAERQGLEEPSE